MKQLFLGQIVHCKALEELEIFTDGYLAVADGKIVAVGERSQIGSLANADTYEKRVLDESQFLLPGFIDCHIHAPQVPNIGLGLDKPLLEWLTSYTFPLESNYRDVDYAKRIYRGVVRDTIGGGTTCACYFATIHNESSKLLADELISQGQRGFVGKVSSNQLCPDFYIEPSTACSVRDNEDFIAYVLSKGNNRVQPIITPRFAITCNMELMKELGRLAETHGLHIQTHISENIGEIETVREQYPSAKNYTDVYDQAKLLTGKCVLAHGVHLETDELAVLSKRGTAIAHCPNSNTNLGSGLCDVRRLLQANIKVGLGTDVSGGNQLSILGAIRAALEVSQHIAIVKKQEIKGVGRVEATTPASDSYTPLNYKDALFLATLGGAQALSLDHQVGNFAVGKCFDALLVDTDLAPIAGYNLPDALLQSKTREQMLLERLQKFVYVGDDRNIVRVFVDGVQVK